MYMQNNWSSVIRGSYLKANGKAAHLCVHTHPSEWQHNSFSSSSAVSFAHVFLTYIFALYYSLTSMQLKKQSRCSKCKRTSLRRATTQQHHTSCSNICYTRSSVFFLPSSSRSTIKQIFQYVIVMSTWSQHAQNVVLVVLLSIAEPFNAPCLHIRIQWDNIDKNRQWTLWNFTTVWRFSTC